MPEARDLKLKNIKESLFAIGMEIESLAGDYRDAGNEEAYDFLVETSNDLCALEDAFQEILNAAGIPEEILQ